MRILSDNKVSFTDIRRVISSLPRYIQRNSLNNLKSLKTVSGGVTVEDIFSVLNENFAWSFLDYYLLERIVQKYGTEELKKTMVEYSNELSNFRRKTTVSKLMSLWYDPNLPPKYEECKEIVLRKKWDPDHFTLDKLEKLRYRTHQLLKEIPLSEAALVLYQAKYGSIVITWIVHIDLVPKFKVAFDQCVLEGVYFKENSIITVELDGEVYMSMERVSG